MNPRLTRKDLVSGLTGIVALAIGTQQLQAAMSVIAGLRVLRPEFREIDLYEAWVQMNTGDMRDASHTLRHLISARPGLLTAKALLAVCLLKLKSSEWEAVASEVIYEATDDEADAEALSVVVPLFEERGLRVPSAGPAKTAAAASGTESEAHLYNYAIRA